MKIAYDAKRFYQNNSGLGNYSRDLVRILASNFPENEYILINKKETQKAADTSALNNVHFRQSSPGIFSRQLHLAKDAKDCDIFHGLSGELPLNWKGIHTKKVVTIHDFIFEILPNYYSFFDRKTHFWKFKKAAEIADVIVAISEQTKTDIKRFLGTPENKIQVIYQGCSHLFKQKYTNEEKDLVRKKYELPAQFILNVGTIEPRKNGLKIVEAINGTDIPLIFIGKETKYTEKIKAFIVKNNLKNQVFFLKNVSNQDLATIYQMAKIFVYPSEYEGFGIPIIEALYSEIPVITNKEGVFPEAGGPSSVYVDIYKTEEIKEAISKLWNNPEMRTKISNEGLQYAQKFNDENIAKQWHNLYASLI